MPAEERRDVPGHEARSSACLPGRASCAGRVQPTGRAGALKAKGRARGWICGDVLSVVLCTFLRGVVLLFALSMYEGCYAIRLF